MNASWVRFQMLFNTFSILWSFQRLLRQYKTHVFQKILSSKTPEESQITYNGSYGQLFYEIWVSQQYFGFLSNIQTFGSWSYNFPNNYCRLKYRKNICTIDSWLRLYFTFKSSFQYHSLRRKKGCVVQILQKA